MDDFEADYKNATKAGQSNLRARKLLSNWCFHAEFSKLAGTGIIEATTGLPIGHMGVRCKFSKKNSMHCWLLEDAVYDFYQHNCKDCSKRIPVGIPNIMEFVGPREESAEKRKRALEEEKKEIEQKHATRQQERAVLRRRLSLDENFVLDLLDELDQEGIERNDPRLEQLASLAPETFTRKVVEHLLPAVLNEHLPYSIPAAKALLNAPLEPEEKLSVAVRLVSSYEKSPVAIEVVLSNAEKLSKGDLTKVLSRFVSMALELPPGMRVGASMPMQLDKAPIQSLFQKRRAEICSEVDALLVAGASPAQIMVAIEIILAADCDELLSGHADSIFAKLMRRRILLPDERRDSSVLYYLRKAASKCLQQFPKESDEIIQSYLADNDNTGREEASMVYSSMLRHDHKKKVHIGTAQRIAFRRLLWAAVEHPSNSMEGAGQFFRHSWDEFAQLAVENFDDLIGAAATLSEKYEQIDAEPVLELADNELAHMEKSSRLLTIDRLQGSLIRCAVVGAKSKGREGIEEFLALYRKLPQDQTLMRGNMIANISRLLEGVESLTLVLSDWYRALMDESTLVRARAVQAWGEVPYDLVKNFPDLFFEALSVLLTDQYVIVHQSAVQSIRRRPFPKEKLSIIRYGLWNLVVCYFQKSKQENFIVDCIGAFAFLCLSAEERKEELGKLLSGILLRLEGSALYEAVNQLHYGFKDVPGFVKVALKSISDDYTRSISVDDCASAILSAPYGELQNCVDDIIKAFKALRPFRQVGFDEALLYAAALTKAGNYAAASSCFRELVSGIAEEDRNKQWQLEASLVENASDIEHALASGEPFLELIEKWRSLMSDLEKEYEERAKLQDFPPSFFFQG